MWPQRAAEDLPRAVAAIRGEGLDVPMITTELVSSRDSTGPCPVRREGGGRHALSSHDPGLVPALDGMVEPTTRGDPESPLRWTCKSARTLAAELTARHHPVSHTKVTQLLREDGYSLQGNRKTEEGDDHPDRDAQFRYINRAVKQALRAGEPVISADTKKKELIGNYQNKGRQWRKKRTAE